MCECALCVCVFVHDCRDTGGQEKGEKKDEPRYKCINVLFKHTCYVTKLATKDTQ